MIPGAVPGAAPEQATASFTNFGEGTAFTRSGELLAIDTFGANVFKFAPPLGLANHGTVVASGSPNWNGIAIGENGDLYVGSSNGGGGILHFNQSGSPLGTIGGLRNPAFLQFGPDGYLYATDFLYQISPGQTDSVVQIAPDGTVTVLGHLLGALGLAICLTSPGPPGDAQGIPSIVLFVLAMVAGVGVVTFATVLWLSRRKLSSSTGRETPTCPNCGAPVRIGSVYCPNCGKPI